MKKFRTVIFWMHLAAGLSAGVVIFIMCVTGALLAFEKNIIEFAERDARYFKVDLDAPRLPVSEVLSRVMAANGELKPSSILMMSEPNATWQIGLGSEGTLYVDPYTGVSAGRSNDSVRGAMSWLRDWHRWLALSGDQRQAGKAVTGAANLLFLFLALSGLYIWMPRMLTWVLIKPVVWFRSGLSGKARNFNWHNTIGFWTSLFLVVFTLTATIMSYQWAGNLLYTITGNEIPQQDQARQPPRPQEVEEKFAVPDGLDAAWADAESRSETRRSISLRLPVSNGQAVFTIDEGIYWNIFGRSTLTVDLANSQTAKWEPYGERNSAQQLRSWFRFTHTGESGGIVGQIIGFIACLGGAFLVWTGFSLAFRRFGKWLKIRHSAAA